MPTTYSIVFKLPESTQTSIRSWYKEISRRDVTVKHLHLSILFSFQNEELDADDIIEIVQQFQFQPFNITLENMVIYQSNEEGVVALTLNEESKATISNVHTLFEDHVKLNFGKAITYDLTKFPEGLPEYEPHISLEYISNGNDLSKLKELQAKCDMMLTINPELFVVFENKNGMLKEYSVPRVAMPDWNS